MDDAVAPLDLSADHSAVSKTVIDETTDRGRHFMKSAPAPRRSADLQVYFDFLRSTGSVLLTLSLPLIIVVNAGLQVLSACVASRSPS